MSKYIDIDNILKLCTEENRVQPPFGRHIYRVNNMIIKIAMDLNEETYDGIKNENILDRDYNEILALELVKKIVPVPSIIFSGKHNNKNIIITEEIKGDILDDIWNELNINEKEIIKNQVIHYIKQCRSITRNIIGSLAIKNQTLLPPHETKIFNNYFTNQKKYYFNHLDLDKSNIIINNNKVVAIIDWEYSGFYTNDVIKEIHKEHHKHDLEWVDLFDNL